MIKYILPIFLLIILQNILHATVDFVEMDADKVVIDGEKISFTDNVKINLKKFYIETQKAVLYQDTTNANKPKLLRIVIPSKLTLHNTNIDEKLTITSDTAEYFIQDRSLSLKGDVTLTHGHYVIKTDKLTYHLMQ